MYTAMLAMSTPVHAGQCTLFATGCKVTGMVDGCLRENYVSHEELDLSVMYCSGELARSVFNL